MSTASREALPLVAESRSSSDRQRTGVLTASHARSNRSPASACPSSAFNAENTRSDIAARPCRDPRQQVHEPSGWFAASHAA